MRVLRHQRVLAEPMANHLRPREGRYQVKYLPEFESMDVSHFAETAKAFVHALDAKVGAHQTPELQARWDAARWELIGELHSNAWPLTELCGLSLGLLLALRLEKAKEQGYV